LSRAHKKASSLKGMVAMKNLYKGTLTLAHPEVDMPIGGLMTTAHKNDFPTLRSSEKILHF
jgi:hypothetical protein